VLGVWVVAYVVAALAGAAVWLVAVGVITNDAGGLSVLPLVAAAVALFALPGFVLLRGVLYWAGIGHVAAFALAGALNALLPSGIVALTNGVALWHDAPILLALALAGTVSGACYRVIERALWLRNAGPTG
jgi:hypothetical protein